MRKMTFVLATALLIAFSNKVLIADEDVVIVPINVIHGTQPQSIVNLISDCVNNQACSTALNVAAAYIGVSAEAVSVLAVGSSALRESGSEDSYHDFTPPNGYKFCRPINYQLILHNPTNGPRTPFVAARLDNPSAFTAYTWVPIKSFGQGRAWIEVLFNILAVRDDQIQAFIDRGECDFKSGSPNHLDCRTADQGPNCYGIFPVR